jgi:glycosyltransferase involved in cell wall biosynthesis
LVIVASRCAWTLHNFRLPLMHAIKAAGLRVLAIGQPLRGFELKLARERVAFEAIPVTDVAFDPLGDLRLFTHLLRLFRRARPAVVHSFTIRLAIFGTLAARMAGVPVRIVTITGLGHAFTTAGLAVRSITHVLYRVALSQAEVVFFQNTEDRALFISRGLVAANKTRLVPGSGIDLDRFVVQPLPTACVGELTFVMIARLLREKGVVEYLEAATIVRRTFPRARFVLVGGVDTRNPSSLSSEEQEEVRRSGCVELVGEVDDVRPYIEDSHVVVLPSYREGIPRSLLEGAAIGRALIATDVPGCRDVVEHGHTGLLVPPRDADALAAAMDALLRDVEVVRALASAARRRVETTFDQRLVIGDTLRTYDELLHPANESPRG